MRTTPPGWYDDGRGALRWWDGTQWTEHVAEPDAEIDPDAPTEAEILAGSTGAAPAGPSGTDAAAGAFTAATARQKSRLWIVWLVGGVLLLAVVVTAAILIPVMLMGVATGGAAQGPQASDEDQAAAIEAVQRYGQAWSTADCDAYLASTTEKFRTEALQLPDCAAFLEAATPFAGSISGYAMTVDAVVPVGLTVSVTASESYSSFFDAEGNPTAEAQHWVDTAEYYVVEADGAWAIDDWFLVEE